MTLEERIKQMERKYLVKLLLKIVSEYPQIKVQMERALHEKLN